MNKRPTDGNIDRMLELGVGFLARETTASPKLSVFIYYVELKREVK